jgi:hypothetical protein
VRVDEARHDDLAAGVDLSRIADAQGRPISLIRRPSISTSARAKSPILGSIVITAPPRMT